MASHTLDLPPRATPLAFLCTWCYTLPTRNHQGLAMKHFVMDATGHSEIVPADAADAAARFLELVQDKKHAAFTRKEGERDYHKIKNPEDQQDETLFVPAMKGG